MTLSVWLTSHNRSINRHQWDVKALLSAGLQRLRSRTVLEALKHLIALRKAQPTFHPNATQFTLHLGDELFGFWRQSLDRRQSLFCVHNLTIEEQILPTSRLNLVVNHRWQELTFRSACRRSFGVDIVTLPNALDY